jgi:hypothetical protein
MGLGLFHSLYDGKVPSPFRLNKKSRRRERRAAKKLGENLETWDAIAPEAAAALRRSSSISMKIANAKRRKKKPRGSTTT